MNGGKTLALLGNVCLPEAGVGWHRRTSALRLLRLTLGHLHS